MTARIVFSLTSCFALAASAAGAAPDVHRLPVSEYVDRMKAGWVGQMAGVGWGGPTEFKVRGKIIPMEQMPRWKPALINQFRQDDIYVEMTFMRTLEQHGWDVSIRQAGIDFANSGYALWHANRAGRDNLRRGIAPPDSGHPQFNKHADDIDYQIEADFSGLIAPGMPQLVVDLGETFGRLMNYGDGVYAGQFVGGLYAEAFFESDPVRIVQAALRCIPPESQYAGMVRDLLDWYATTPDDWQNTWQRVEDKYHKNPAFTHGLCSKPGNEGAFSIDAKLNGAYIIMGLLYGKGDPDQTILISTRCGQDSDCNPSNAAGVLFTTIGFTNLPARFTSAIDPNGKFSHTPYTFPALVDVSRRLVRQAVVRAGGRLEKTDTGEDVLVIPVTTPTPGKLERSWEPGPIASSRFTEAEMARITPPAKPDPRAATFDLSATVKAFAPGWSVHDCGADMEPGLRPTWGGRKHVLVTHPLSQATACVLSRTVAVPAGKTTLRLTVTHDPRGDWTLIVRADGKQLARTRISKGTVKEGWKNVAVDLSPFAGKTIALDLVNQADGWSWEAGYWASIAIDSKN